MDTLNYAELVKNLSAQMNPGEQLAGGHGRQAPAQSSVGGQAAEARPEKTGTFSGIPDISSGRAGGVAGKNPEAGSASQNGVRDSYGSPDGIIDMFTRMFMQDISLGGLSPGEGSSGMQQNFQRESKSTQGSTGTYGREGAPGSPSQIPRIYSASPQTIGAADVPRPVNRSAGAGAEERKQYPGGAIGSKRNNMGNSGGSNGSSSYPWQPTSGMPNSTVPGDGSADSVRSQAPWPDSQGGIPYFLEKAGGAPLSGGATPDGKQLQSGMEPRQTDSRNDADLKRGQPAPMGGLFSSGVPSGSLMEKIQQIPYMVSVPNLFTSQKQRLQEGNKSAETMQMPDKSFKPPSSGFKPPSSGFKPPSSGFKPPSSGFKPPSSPAESLPYPMLPINFDSFSPPYWVHPASVGNSGKESDKETSSEMKGVKGDFPLLNQEVNGKQLVWLDNGATTQKPRAVLDRLMEFYSKDNSNVHRGAHTLAARSTEAYEKAREKIQGYLHAASEKEIIFTRGTTEAINLAARSMGRKIVGPGDRILVSMLEHHSNIIPWQVLAKETGASLVPVPIDVYGNLDMDEYERLLNSRVKIAAFTHVSNTFGTVMPVREITDMAHKYGALVLIDGAQAVAHVPVDVQEIDCDFYAFSGHKIYAPTGIGALYGKKEILDEMPVWQTGGSMIETVSFGRTVYKEVPYRFEAGTGNIADAVGLHAALEYVENSGREQVFAHEVTLIVYALDRLSSLPEVLIVGQPQRRAGVISFIVEGETPQHVAAFLNQEGIAVRSGFHCAEPGLRSIGLDEGTVRASFGLYNDEDDVDRLVEALYKMIHTSN